MTFDQTGRVPSSLKLITRKERQIEPECKGMDFRRPSLISQIYEILCLSLFELSDSVI